MNRLLIKLLPFVTATCLASASFLVHAETTLKYMMWDPSQMEVEQAAIAEFEAANPDVKVEIEAMPPKDYWPKLSALAAADDLPDVFTMSSGFVKEWAEAGNLMDLTETVEGTDLSAYYEGAMSVGEIDGGLYAFPQNWVAPVMFFNKDMFDEADIDYPSADWTWDDFKAAAKALTKDTNADGTPDQWGFWLYGRYAHVDTWVFRNGGKYLNDDESGLEVNDAAKNTLSFLTGLVTDGVAPKPQVMEGIRQQDVFPMGMAAMWVDGSWNIADVRKGAGDSFKWGIAQVPKGPDATDETAAAYAWADLLSIGKNSENADLAWSFVQHMVGEGRSASDFLGGKVPAFRSIAESSDWLESDQQPDNKALILEIGAQQVYTGFSKSWGKWRGYIADGAGGMNGELDEVFNGRKSLDEAIESFTAYGNEVLSN